MWNKETQPEAPGTSSSKDSRIPGTPLNAVPGIRPGTPVSRPTACLGATIVVKGEITSDEDLQIDGKVEGPIVLRENRLTVGRTAHLNSQVTAREVVVYGQISGNVTARERVEIKKDGQVIGDITTTRISLEEGAYFKGHIEIERLPSAVSETQEKEAEEIPVGAAF
jgi:cytoskeletal protein CcmA (bactofilin family)